MRSVAVDSAAVRRVRRRLELRDVVARLDGAVPSAVCPHPNWVYSVALDHSGRWLATGCRDKQVHVFDLTI